MNEMSIPTTFSIDFIGELEKVNDLISKVGVRVYYKGGNNNGTWITDDFSEKLNQTIFHVPIVATYNPETEDFEDHQDNGDKKAYGFVPGNAELAWMKAEDGKTYLTTEVYLWVGYWPEAAKIIGKSQSMELDKNTIIGDWKVINGDYYFVYQAGAFKGLCTLGDAVLPCFEKAAFFNLDEDSRLFFQNINKMNEENSGGEKMDKDLNSETTEVVEPVAVVEEFSETTEETPVETTEEVSTVENTEDSANVENAEEFSDESSTEEFEEGETTPIVSSDSLTVVERHSEAVANPDGSVTDIRTETIQTIDIQTYYELQAENEKLKEQISTLEAENASLAEYKAMFAKQEKMAVIDSFKRKLSEEEVLPFIESINDYSTDELKTKLSVALANKVLEETTDTEPQQSQFVAVPGKTNESGTLGILKKYRKN